MRGHIPPLPGTVAGPAELPVAGPLARSAEDLLLELEFVAGPDALEDTAYRWKLPSPRKTKLGEYRIRYVVDDPFCPVDSAVKEILGVAIESLRKSGAQLTEGWPEAVDPNSQYQNYAGLLAAFLSQTVPDAAFKEMQQAAVRGADDPWVKGTTASHRDWLRQSGQRLKARAMWQEYFRTHDAFMMPVAFVSAFPHDHNRDMNARKVMTTEGERSYTDIGKWIAFATLTGCPATVAPVGTTTNRLPVACRSWGRFWRMRRR